VDFSYERKLPNRLSSEGHSGSRALCCIYRDISADAVVVAPLGIKWVGGEMWSDHVL
jgi:hypothetical protein